MKHWREPKIGKKVKRPKSKRMEGLATKSSQTTRKMIKQQKQKQAKILKKIETDLKEIKYLIISLSGLKSLSENSIKQIQIKREKTVLRLIRSVSDFTVATRELKKLETKYKKNP